jgi:hypothetical protein
MGEVAAGRTCWCGDLEGPHRRRVRPLRCDCGLQPDLAMEMIAAEGAGARVPARPRGPGHRPRAQDPRLHPPGPGPRHGGGQCGARLPGRLPRVRHRLADVGRPRPVHDAADDQQSVEVRRPGGLRSRDRGAGVVARAAQRGEHPLPADRRRRWATSSTSSGTRRRRNRPSRTWEDREGQTSIDATGMRMSRSSRPLQRAHHPSVARRRAAVLEQAGADPSPVYWCRARSRSRCWPRPSRAAASATRCASRG